MLWNGLILAAALTAVDGTQADRHRRISRWPVLPPAATRRPPSNANHLPPVSRHRDRRAGPWRLAELDN